MPALIPQQLSTKLMPCLIKLETNKTDGKLELLAITKELMPAGKPKFLDIIKYPMITDLVKQHGKKTLLKALFLLIKDFCGSINVVRNMNDDQMIETADMLLDECDNFRLEDYTIMFAMAKRGEIGNIFDHLDIQVITKMVDQYWDKRFNAAQGAREGYISRLDSIGNTNTQLDLMNPHDRKLTEGAEKLAASMEKLKDIMDVSRLTDQEAKADIHTPAVSYEVKKDATGDFITTKKNK